MYLLVLYFSLLVVAISQENTHSHWKDCENYTAKYCLHGKCIERYELNEKINACLCNKHWTGRRCETRVLAMSYASKTKFTTNVLNNLIKTLDSKNSYNVSIFMEILIIILILITLFLLAYTSLRDKKKTKNGSIIPSSDEL